MILAKKLEGLQDAIRMQDYLLAGAQTEIRKAERIIEEMQQQYRRAMEEKINLQDRLVDVLLQQHEAELIKQQELEFLKDLEKESKNNTT